MGHREKLNNTREDMNKIRFERVHRLPTRQNSRTRTKPRPIIAKCIFRWYEADTVRYQVMFFRVLLEHVVRACLQGLSGWLVFSI